VNPYLLAASLASCVLLSLPVACSSSSSGSPPAGSSSSGGSSGSSSSGSSSGGGEECSSTDGDGSDALCSYSYGGVCGGPLVAGPCPAANLAGCCGQPGVGGNCYYGMNASSENAKSSCTGGANGTWYTTPP
jgi:mannan endo-1,4-beta-mannosidase